MKIHGKNISQPTEEITVIPRSEGDIVFKAKAVLDFKVFNELCPEPSLPIRHYADGREEPDPDDSGYKKKLDDWAQQKSSWMIIQSLSATEGLTWDTIEEENPETWTRYREELEQDFTPGEINAIHEAVFKANAIDDSKLEEAKNHFLAAQQQA